MIRLSDEDVSTRFVNYRYKTSWARVVSVRTAYVEEGVVCRILELRMHECCRGLDTGSVYAMLLCLTELVRWLYQSEVLGVEKISKRYPHHPLRNMCPCCSPLSAIQSRPMTSVMLSAWNATSTSREKKPRP